MHVYLYRQTALTLSHKSRGRSFLERNEVGFVDLAKYHGVCTPFPICSLNWGN